MSSAMLSASTTGREGNARLEILLQSSTIAEIACASSSFRFRRCEMARIATAMSERLIMHPDDVAKLRASIGTRAASIDAVLAGLPIVESAAISPGSLVVMNEPRPLVMDFAPPHADYFDAFSYACMVTAPPPRMWLPAPSMAYVVVDWSEPKPRKLGKSDQRRAKVRAGLRMRCLLKRVPVSLRKRFGLWSES